MSKFNLGDWAYVVDDVEDSCNLMGNSRWDRENIKNKAGKRLKITWDYGTMRYRDGDSDDAHAYQVSGYWFAEHELMSLDEHRAYAKILGKDFTKNALSLL